MPNALFPALLALAVFVLSYAGVGSLRRWAERRQILDVPNERSSHTMPTPRGGGLAIAGIVLLGLLILALARGGFSWRGLTAYLVTGALIAWVGWMDDRRSLSARFRLGVQIGVAVIAIAGLGHFTGLRLPFGASLHLGWLGIPFTLVWIVGLINAYNFMDGIDGLAGGQAVVAGVFWIAVAWQDQLALAAGVGMLTAATSLGFLAHNWPPARIFMGDVGSGFLGYTFALLPLLASPSDPALPLVGALLVWPFIFDTALTFLRRLQRRENIFQAHRSHLYQRLVIAGLPHVWVTMLYLGLACLGGLVGVSWVRAWPIADLIILLIPCAGLGLWAGVVWNERWAASATMIGGRDALLNAHRGDREAINAMEKTQPIQPRFNLVRNRYFLLLDFLLLAMIPFVSLFLRVDTEAWSAQYRQGLWLLTALGLGVKLPVFYAMGLYRRYWRYASVADLTTIVLTVGITGAVIAMIFLAARTFDLVTPAELPRSVPFIDGVLTLLAVGGTRFSVRAIASARRARSKNGPLESKRVLVVGAGDAGAMILREMQNSARVRLEPVGFVDDDWTKHGMSIFGVPVLGSRTDIPKLVEDYGIQEVIIAMPTASGKVIREIVALCEAARVPSRTMPGIYEILSGRVGVSQLRSVEIEDLLRREPVQIDSEEVTRMLAGTRVMVTGGGGSIGSELCRQIARCGPVQLTLLGHGENSLFLIENELRHQWPGLPLDVIVADIRDRARLQVVFEQARPQIVFHTAAHKHVPLMERNLEDAITNNVGGTRNLVRLSVRYGVERFVLISSDKAVNPANVMGATKRVAEMIVQEAAWRTGRAYVSVRFGNVLGSRGSVVPIFRQQITLGGPVTVTHPDVRRYFMTIPEAVQLVLQAAALGRTGGYGEVFVLDMGEPIKIIDLARDLVELSGLEVGRDIDIVFTGLRPGEKLYEELFEGGEEYRRTRHEKILVASDLCASVLLPADQPTALEAQSDRLLQAAKAGRVDDLLRLLREIVPNYHPLDQALVGRDSPGGTVHSVEEAVHPPVSFSLPSGKKPRGERLP